MALEAGNYTTVAVGYAGIGRATFYRWMQRGRDADQGIYREFYESVRRALAIAEVRAVAIVRRHMAQRWRACLAWLERRHDQWEIPGLICAVGKRGQRFAGQIDDRHRGVSAWLCSRAASISMVSTSRPKRAFGGRARSRNRRELAQRYEAEVPEDSRSGSPLLLASGARGSARNRSPARSRHSSGSGDLAPVVQGQVTQSGARLDQAACSVGTGQVGFGRILSAICRQRQLSRQRVK